MANTIVVQALVTKTAVFNGASIAIDNTVFPSVPNWTLVVEVRDSGPSDTLVRFQFSDSVDAFTTVLSGPTFVCPGGVKVGNPKRFTVRQSDFPDLRFGVANAVLRLSLTRITGFSQTVSYLAWLEV
jgi:hypothetical protein